MVAVIRSIAYSMRPWQSTNGVSPALPIRDDVVTSKMKSLYFAELLSFRPPEFTCVQRNVRYEKRMMMRVYCWVGCLSTSTKPCTYCFLLHKTLFVYMLWSWKSLRIGKSRFPVWFWTSNIAWMGSVVFNLNKFSTEE